MKKEEVGEVEDGEEEEEEPRSPTGILGSALDSALDSTVKRKQSSLKSLSGAHC